MLSQLYAIPTEEPRETPAETAMVPLARMVRDEWVTTFFRDSFSKDNWTQEDREKREEYLTLMLKEPAVSTAFWSLIASVMSLPMKVHAADPDNPKDVYWSNFVRDAIGCVQGGVPKMIANTAAGGLLFGFGLCEMVFDYPERGKWTKNLVLDQYAPIDSRFVKFDLDPFKRVVGVRPTKANGGQVFGPERFAIFSHQSLFGSPFGLSKFRPAYRAAKMMESAIKLRVILLQNFTGPFLVLKSGGATSRETAMRVLSEARALGYMVCDRQDEAQVLNMAAGSDSEFQSAIDDLRKEMYTAIRWGYLPFTEAASGVQVGNSEVQRSMTQLGEWMLATEIAQVFTEQIAKPLIRFNCPDDSVGFPSISLGGQNSTDKRAVGEIFEQAKRLNVILSKRQVQRALDIEEPAGKEDELRDPVQPGPGGGNPFMDQGGFDPLAGMGPGLGGGGAPGGPGGPAPDGGGAPVPAGGPAPTGGNPQTQPDPHDKVDFSHIDPTIGRVSPVEMDKAALVAALDLRAKAVSLGQPGRFQRAIDALRSMIGNHPAMRAAIMSGGKITDSAPPPADQKFGWMAESTKSGGTKAVGTGEHAGRTLYGQDAQRAIYPGQHGAASPAQQAGPTSGSKAAEGPKANPTSGSKTGLTRGYAAGFNKDSGITFANENQRDLFDLGAKIRAGMRSGRPADTSAMEQSLSSRLGIDPSEVHAKALDVHADLKKQMAGVKEGETRSVKDNHETQGYQSLGKQVSTMGMEQAQATRDKLAPTPAVEAMAEKLTDHVAAQTGEKLKAGPAAELLHEHLANAKGLTDDQRETYGNAIDRVTFNMPDAAHARLAKHLGGGVTFHADTAGIGSAVKRDVLSIAREDRHGAIEEKFKGSEGQKFGGGYVLGKGSVHIDGGKDGASPHEVYAHVLGHAIDGPQHEISNSDKWWDAFTSEIAMTPEGKYPLGQHAGRTPEDGFAEFSRLLYASDVPHEQVAAKFPRATAVFRSHSLLPDGFGEATAIGPDVAANRPKHGLSTVAMARYGKGQRDETPNEVRLPMIFGGRLDVHPDGSHIDLLAGKPQPGQAEPTTEQPTYREQFQNAHAQGDEPAAHDLIAEALQGKHGEAVQAAVGDALDEHYKAGAPGGEKAKRDAILDAVAKVNTPDMGDAYEGDLSERKSTLSAEDDPFAMPQTATPDDEFPDTKGVVTGADLLGKLNAIGDDGKAIRKPKGKDAGGDSLHQIVTKSGGIDPTSPDFLKHFEGVDEAVEYGIPRTVFKIGGREPYDIAKELHNEGHIHIEGQSDDAPDVDGTDHLFQQLATGAKSLHSQGDRADRAADENARREQEESEPRVDSIRLNGRKVDGTGVDNGYRYYIRRHHGAETYSFDGGQTWATDKGKAFEGRVVEKEFKVPATRGEDVANPPATPKGLPAGMTAESAAEGARLFMKPKGGSLDISGIDENINNQPPEANKLTGDEGTSNVANQLEATGGGSDQERLPGGQLVGSDAGSSPTIAPTGSGEGTEPERGLPSVSPGSDEQLSRRVFGDGGSGDGPARSPVVSDADVIADPAGRDRPARGVGAGSRNVRPDGSNGAILEQSEPEKSLAKPSTPENPTGAGAANFRYDSSDFFAHGLKAKFAANVAAIRTLQTIKAEGRTAATPEEQQILSRFVGWGQFPALFNHADHAWSKEREVFRDLMGGYGTPEWDAAKRSTLNAHYTHPDVVKAHWRMAQRLGFDGGRYLETSAGIGYYLGMMPPELAGKTRATAIELEKTTGEMLKHLYPKAVVKVQGFQDHKPPKDFYDLIASNVPFGDYKVHDPDYNRHQANIHDYFFLKSATHLRPGGLMMHITSTGTLDKPDSKIRAELAKTCDLVGAIRFPGAAHKENAGTDVVTDMVILRKRLPGEQPGNMDWLETTTVPDPAGGEPIPVNKHFANNPHMVLGTLDRTGTMYQGNSVNVSRTDDYEQRLEAAIQGLPEGVFTKASKTVSQEPFAPVVDDPGKNKNGAFVLHEGKLHVKEGDSLIPKTVDPKTAERITGHIQIRDAVRGVINAQIQGGDADAARKALNKVYDEFVRKHGPLNSQANRKAFATDPDSPVLLAIENYDAKTKKAAKADIFTKNTVRSTKKADSAGSPEEALGISLHEHGSVNIAHMAKLTGKSPEEIGGHLVSKGLAFEDPSHGWKHASEYLSGNVRKKLALARAAAEVDPKFQANVAALEAIQPQDVSHEDIDVKLGASWLPPSDYARFAAELLDGQPEHFKITYNPHDGSWLADFTSRGASALRNRRGNREVYGTARREFMDLLEPALNGQTVTIYDKTSDGTSVVNREETDNANAKIQEIKDKFKDWVWTDDERRERLHRHYNDNFNNTVPMKYDGAHQQFPGMNPHIDLRPHQKDFVWQTVTTGKGLAAHEVGTGKTYTMAAAAMELRRLGLAKKPAIACLKANIDQVAKEAQELYPHARILAVDKFDASNRKKIISQMATGDYDMVILTHDNLNMLQMKPETTSRFIKEELDELEAAKLSVEAEGGNKKGNRIVKQLEKAKENLEAKLKEALDASKKDDAVFFEETGIDHLFVDEAHKYKSLPVYTKQDRVKGIPTSRSDRATGMLMRTRWLMEQNGGRGVTFATGTPVANTMAELFNMQRYLQPDELKERGIHTFNSWASTFGDIATKMEFSTTGEYKPVSRFARFVNIPELMQTARQIMDVQRATGLKNKEGQSTIKRPNRKDFVVESPHSPQMKGVMSTLRQRAMALKNDKDSKDNMLVIGTDGKKAAIDIRLLSPDYLEGHGLKYEDHPDSKVNKAIQNVLQIHKDNPGKTQMIFSDVGVHPMKHGFHLYEDIIQKLEKGGIPRDKIVNFADLDTKAKKEAGIMALKTGKALVGIGGTDRMGTGVNAQDHLIALHHLDIPYQPAEVEQRDGRGWRQGNTNKDVHIYRYVAHGSLDQTFWQIIDNKSRFIKQVLTPGTVAPREAKDEDTEELTPEQLMAAASGDPKILEKVQTDEDIRQLSAAEKRHLGEQIKFRESIARGERGIPAMKERHENLKKDAEHAEKTPKFSLKLNGGGTFENRDEANEALTAAFEKAPDPYGHGVRLGEIRGMGVYKVGGQMQVRGPSGESYQTGFTVGSIEHVIRNLKTEADKQAAEIERTKSELEKVRSKIGLPFPKTAELEAKRNRSKELENYLRGDFLPEGYSVGQEIQMADGRKVKIVGTIPNKQIKVSDGKSEFHIGHDDLPEIKK